MNKINLYWILVYGRQVVVQAAEDWLDNRLQFIPLSEWKGDKPTYLQFEVLDFLDQPLPKAGEVLLIEGYSLKVIKLHYDMAAYEVEPV